MWVGIGVGIGRNRFATGIFNDYALRVTADGGITEAGQCVDAVTGLLLNASLLLIPSGYKGGKLYSEIPTNGNGDLTWTRGSDAFRTNASGLIQRVPWNLLQQSETFANASWSKSASSITANSITSPNGTITADTFTGDGTLSNHRISQSLSFMSEVTYTISCYVKKDTNSYFQIYFPAGQFTSAAYANYDLDTGTLGTVGSNATASIENVGNSWYRCVATATATSSAANSINFGLISSSTSARAESNSISTSVYIWGAQLVEGTTAQTYLPTTDRLGFPRLDYTYGSCPSALLEPQRTNLVLRSEEFDNASWTKQDVTVTANSTTAPDGNTTADTIVANSTTTNHDVNQLISITSGVNYTISAYFKKGTTRYVYIQSQTTGAGGLVVFDLDTATFTQQTTYVGNFSSVGSGWYRVTATFTATATASVRVRWGLTDSSTNPTSTLTTSDNIFIWGAQLEVGAYPTTYIPTTGSATATRVADSFSRNNIFTNGLITSSGGTWFVELRNNISYLRDNSNRWGICDTTNFSDNGIGFRASSSGRYSLIKCISTAVTTLYTTTAETCKIAIKWNGTTADIFENGVKVVSATAFTTTLMEFIAMNSSFGSGIPTFIQQMALFPTPLSDTDCTTLTT